MIQKLALRIGLSEWFRFVRLSLPAIFFLAIYFLDLQFDLFGILKAILVFSGLEIISDAPDLLSKVRPRTEPILIIGADFIELDLENKHRRSMDGLISLQAETHWWPLKRNTITLEYPEKTETIRTNLLYEALFRRLSQLGQELQGEH